jgi:pyridoxal phosphate enzyme (YggS family)
MRSEYADLEANLASVRRRMREAAVRSGRDWQAVQLVAVTKGRTEDQVRRAYELGLRVFGENRVLEGRRKIDALSDLTDVEWHMIGHVQSRKARDVAGAYKLVHSVDRLRLAKRLDSFARESGVHQPILLECNVSGEEAKHGWRLEDETQWDRCLPDFEALARMPNLEIRGLMTMAPWSQNVDMLREVFGRLRTLRAFLVDQLPTVEWVELSMGMTDDFEVAIEQGATMIRVGRALFGEMTA